MAKPIDKINLQPSHIRAYNFIAKSRAKNLYSPDMDEVAKGIKLTPRQAYRVVDDLIALGYMSKEMYKRRSLKILKPLR